MDSGFEDGGGGENGMREGNTADGAVIKQSDQSLWLDLFAPNFVDRRLQIHEGYARGSLLVWRKNLRRHSFPPGCLVTAWRRGVLRCPVKHGTMEDRGALRIADQANAKGDGAAPNTDPV